MINDDAEEVIKELFQSFLSRHKIRLETPNKGSEFVFDCFQLLYYKCHKINQNSGGLYIDSQSWVKNKKATINPINKRYNKCFQYSKIVSLN